MENRRFQKLGVIALIISLIPLVIFVPTLFNMTLTDEIRSIWSGVNIFSVFSGLLLSIICVKNCDSRNMINIISTIISSFLLVLICGIVFLYLYINFIK